jgi:hypothetical protein
MHSECLGCPYPQKPCTCLRGYGGYRDVLTSWLTYYCIVRAHTMKLVYSNTVSLHSLEHIIFGALVYCPTYLQP